MGTLGTAVAFRTTEPSVIDAFHVACKARTAWGREMVEWVETNLGTEFVLVTSAAFGTESAAGIQRRDEKAEPGPGKGWRYVRSRGLWIPDQRYKAGKELTKRFDPNKNRAPSVRHLTPGMPGFAFDAGTPGLAMRDGALWASWAHDFGDEWWRKEGVDFDLWERVPLSEFYAAAEKAGEAA